MRPRISLLQPAPEYIAQLPRNRIQSADPPYRDTMVSAVVQQPPPPPPPPPPGPAGAAAQLELGPPFKKIRLGGVVAGGEAKSGGGTGAGGIATTTASTTTAPAELQQPLRIDTRPVYTPQVEAISPTLPSDSLQEDSTFRSTKDDLLQQIGKVDREIAKAESQIQKLKKKQQELEEVASKPAIVKEEEEIAQPKHQSLAQKIYADNRKKAQEAHSLLDKLGPKVELPLYNQPSDTPVYHENKRRHITFKKRLMEHFKRKHSERESREKYMTATYSRLMQEWLRKVEKIESSAKRKAKEAKSREFFEKVFPELRKQREDKERFNRVGARIKSEADLEEIMDGLQEQEMEDKKMRSYAVIPPILLDAKQRKLTYQNNNGLIEDFVSEYKERQLLNVWTEQEREIFREKYLQHPKNFGLVASYLERKSVCDCVQHYYLSKKTEGYRQLLRKSRQRARASRNAQKPTAAGGGAAGTGMATGTAGAVDPGTTGVTTRQSVAALQREQQQRELREQRQQQEREREHTTSDGMSNSIAPRDSSPVPSAGMPVTLTSSEGSSTGTTTSAPTVAGSAVVSIVSMASGTTSGSGILSPSNSSGVQSTAGLCSFLVTDSVPDKEMDKENKSSSEGKLENKKERRKEEKKKKKEEVDSSDEECVDNQEKGGPHLCVVCKATVEQFLLSRPLPRSHAAQYGLRDEDVPPGARVCNSCRCKSVRSRYTQCPIPTCPTAKGRAKRLRPLPGKWADLPPEVKEPIIAEFQIPASVTKCCSACFNRISRRLSPNDGAVDDGSGSSSAAVAAATAAAAADQSRWTDEEIDLARRALGEFGLGRWNKISEHVGTKSEHQCKNFYFNYRKKLGLDAIIREYNETHLGEEGRSKGGGDGAPPTVTDEEESGSSTSSCDEAGIAPDSSDTASAASPNPAPAAPTTPSSESRARTDRIAAKNSESMDAESEKSVLNVEEERIGTQSPQSLEQQRQSAGMSMPSVSAAPPSTKEDYDSSATETADEGQGGSEVDGTGARGSPKNYAATQQVTPQTPNRTPDQQHRGHGVVSEANGSGERERESGEGHTQEVLTMKDLMQGVIEMQLKKNPQGPHQQSHLSGSHLQATVHPSQHQPSPTISSILKTTDRPDIAFVREYKSSPAVNRIGQQPQVEVPPQHPPNSRRPGASQEVGASLQQRGRTPPVQPADNHRAPSHSQISMLPSPHHNVSSHHLSQHHSQTSSLSTHHIPHHVGPMPLPGGAGTMVVPTSAGRADLPKEGLVVVQLQQVQQALRESGREPEAVTLDLSLKKRDDSPPTGPPSNQGARDAHLHHSLHHPPPAHSKAPPLRLPEVMIREVPPPLVYREPYYQLHQHQSQQPITAPPPPEQARNKSPSVYVPDGRSPHLVMSSANRQPTLPPSAQITTVNATPKAPKFPWIAEDVNLVRSQGPHPLPASKMGSISPKPLLSKTGSITHGTPVSPAAPPAPQHASPRYDGLSRQPTPPQQLPTQPAQPKEGSITQGTPVHHDPKQQRGKEARPQAYDSRGVSLVASPAVPYDPYYVRPSPGGPGAPQGHHPPPPPPPPTTTDAYHPYGNATSGFPYPARPPYPIEQQLSSRQIIMNDYITSQQMHGRRGSGGAVAPSSGAEKDARLSPGNPASHHASPSLYYPSPGTSPAPPPGSVYLPADVRHSRHTSPAAPEPPPSRTPPPPPPPPPRQGVIQRHHTPSGRGGKPISGVVIQQGAPSSPPERYQSPGSSQSPQAQQQQGSQIPQHQQHHLTVGGSPRTHLHHGGYPPGHEALSSLVDLAVQQPSLPVPKDEKRRPATPGPLHPHRHHQIPQPPPGSQHEGLGKSMADSMVGSARVEHLHQHQFRQQQQQQERERLAHHHQQMQIHQQMQLQHSMQQQQQMREQREREREHLHRQQQQHQQQQQQQHQQQQMQQQQHAQQQHVQQQQHAQQQQQHAQQQQQHAQQQQQQHHHQQQQQQAARIAEQDRQRHMAVYREHSHYQIGERERERGAPPQQISRDGSSNEGRQANNSDLLEREATRMLVGSFPRDARPRHNVGSGAIDPRGSRGDSTLTAASLIDAIITRQINQGSDQDGSNNGPNGGTSAASRPGDRLFQGFHRDHHPHHPPVHHHRQVGSGVPTSQSLPVQSIGPESNGKASPLRPSVGNPPASSPAVTVEEDGPENREGGREKTLAEHIASIITKDMAGDTGSSAYPSSVRQQSYQHHHHHNLAPPPPPNRGPTPPRHQPTPPPLSDGISDGAAEHHSWKLRRALQKEMEMKERLAADGKAAGLASDERQIIRIAQPAGRKTPPSAGPNASHRVRSASPPGSAGSEGHGVASGGNHWMQSAVGSGGDHMPFLPRRFYPETSPADRRSQTVEPNRAKQQQQQPHMSPLDYVKNRIVEVMRTSDEGGGGSGGDSGRQEVTARHYKRGARAEEREEVGGKRSRTEETSPAGDADCQVDGKCGESGDGGVGERAPETADSPQSGEMVIDEGRASSAASGGASGTDSAPSASRPDTVSPAVAETGREGPPASASPSTGGVFQPYTRSSPPAPSPATASAFPAAPPYPYPYSALSVRAIPASSPSASPGAQRGASPAPPQGAGPVPSPAPPQPSPISRRPPSRTGSPRDAPNVRGQEPAPLLSAQYEPLSDED